MSQTTQSRTSGEPEDPDEVPPVPRQQVPRVREDDILELPDEELPELARDEVPEPPEPAQPPTDQRHGENHTDPDDEARSAP